MSELDKALAGLAESLERFEKAAENYIPVLIRKRQAEQAEALAAQKRREEANARAAAEREFIETYAPKVQAMWELVMSKFGRTH